MNQAHKIQVLLVEDDDVDAKAIQRGFREHGIDNKIVRARDGIEALEIMENNKIERPFIILLDLEMPKMGGIKFLEVIREREEYKDLVAFILTTSEDEEDMLASYRLQTAGYILKSKAGQTFSQIIKMLSCYWHVVYLPE